MVRVGTLGLVVHDEQHPFASLRFSQQRLPRSLWWVSECRTSTTAEVHYPFGSRIDVAAVSLYLESKKADNCKQNRETSRCQYIERNNHL
jgi:hypothetical protein